MASKKTISAAPYARNARKITKGDIELLRESLLQLGDLGGIIYNVRTKQIPGGNQRSFKVFDINECEVEITHRNEAPDDQGTLAWGFVIWEGHRYQYREVDWDETREAKANLVANKLGGTWDHHLLQQFFTADELLEAGFKRTDLRWLNNLKGFVRPNRRPQSSIVGETNPGDFYKLNDHVLFCGDSTKPETFEQILDGRLADIVITDPPYNVDYQTSRTGANREVLNDKMPKDRFADFLADFFTSLNAHVVPGGAWYVFHADTEGEVFRREFRQAGIYLSQSLVWAKDHHVIGRNDYHWHHEPILYGWKDKPAWTDPTLLEAFFNWLKDQGQEERVPAVYQKGYEPLLYGWKMGGSHNWTSDRTQSTLLEFPKQIYNERHPTEKPVGLINYLLNNNSEPGDLLVDAFTGSGSALEAAEDSGRIFAGVELNPMHVDDAILRWVDYMEENKRPVTILKNGKKASKKRWQNG